MSYIAPSPLDFNLRRDYVAPLGDAIAFNLGVELSDSQSIGVIDFALDDCVGVFVGSVPQKAIGELAATLDDCVGSLSAAWLFQPQSISVGVLARRNTAKVHSVLVQSPIESAQLSTRQTHAAQQQASVLERQTVSALEQCVKLSKNTRHHATDLHTHTHKFDSNLFKEPPVQYRYTPTAVFDFEITLNERSFSVTTDEFVSENPVNFNLIETIATGFDFDLGESFTQPITRTRQIFDNVSTYQPETLFFAPWVNDHLIFNHSYQRAGLRLATHNQIQRADVIAKNYKNKIQAAIKAVFRFKQSQNNALKISLKYNQALNIAQKIADLGRNLVSTQIESSCNSI